jgi:N4-(beta-N-acetylglucosaminyl)-L-asparaginase
MTTRREFIVGAGAGLAALGTSRLGLGQEPARSSGQDAGRPLAERTGGEAAPGRKPVVVSTWNHGIQANEEAWKIIGAGGRALDAVEKGVMVVEADPAVQSVGYGGLPDRDGHVTLDACIMNERGDAGSVCFLQNIKHPVAVARRVMEDSPHVMLAGEGARRFAVDMGFPEEDLLTDEARQAWQRWLKGRDYQPWSPEHDPSAGPRKGRPAEDHDTISMLALDAAGNLSGSCTTSGLSYKMHGRVGDSPIIGAALFVDNEVGAACATGVGEEVIKTVGSFLIVELMRQGASPQEACREAVGRIVARHPGLAAADELQVGYLALDVTGRVGAHAIMPWFQYALCDGTGNRLVDVDSHFSGSE